MHLINLKVELYSLSFLLKPFDLISYTHVHYAHTQCLQHTQGSGGSSDDRFYVHPRARGDSSRGGQKSGSSSGGGGEKRHSQHNPKPPSKSGSEKPTKVV